MENRKVRIADIAEELGLSTATVANVIHGKTKKISDETVKRVQELLEKRQYIPNMAGILLAQNDSKIVGVVTNDHEKYEGHTLEDQFILCCLWRNVCVWLFHWQYSEKRTGCRSCEKGPEDKMQNQWTRKGIPQGSFFLPLRYAFMENPAVNITLSGVFWP